MNTERLFPVVVAPCLLADLEPYVRVMVQLAKKSLSEREAPSGQPKDIDVLETLLSDWGNLGCFAAMPGENLLQLPPVRRSEVLASYGFRLSVLQEKSETTIEWHVLYDGISDTWLDILLNCLEAYHVQVAGIAEVRLSSKQVDGTTLESPSAPHSSKDVGSRPERRARWWPRWLG